MLALALHVAGTLILPLPQAGSGRPNADPVPLRLQFAVIGDYGSGSANESAVARLVAAWNPEILITLGDNNYPLGERATIDAHIGQFYSEFIHPYVGVYGPGATVNRFFPALGNHDWYTSGAAPYLAYFTLPGNERTYDFVRGPVHFLALDSDANEPEGITAGSPQARWLRDRLAASRSPFDIVYFHHAAYSSSIGHGSISDLQWPFREWGADLVLAGHDHDYERIVRDGFPYIVNGLGGYSLYGFAPNPVAGSVLRFNSDYGAMLVDAGADRLKLRFVTKAGAVMDTFTLPAGGVDFADVPLVPAGAEWRHRDNGVDPGPTWRDLGFDDTAWKLGPAELGYGEGDEATLVRFGPNADQRHITTWFRRTISVPDPNVFRSLALEVLRDDGAIVYLNGVEAYRSNIPAGAANASTLASSDVLGGDEGAFWGLDLPPSRLQPGDNVVAVEVHQSNTTSDDLSFDLRLTGYLKGAVLSPRAARWRYLDTGVGPPANWTQPGFDDSTWSSGPAQLGYGDGDEGTVVSYGPDPQNKHLTTWFRRNFNAPDPDAFRALLLRIQRDDGVAVYLNGTEVYRGNLPQSGLSGASQAAHDVFGYDENTFFETFVDARLLVPGTNLLAVEVHQVNGQSADLSFDLELSGL